MSPFLGGVVVVLLAAVAFTREAQPNAVSNPNPNPVQ